jgi:hypothetical protein
MFTKSAYCIHVRLSAGIMAAPTGEIFVKIGVDFYENLSVKFSFG